MPNTDHSDFTRVHETSTRLEEEEDLWDLEEEWDDTVDGKPVDDDVNDKAANDELTSDPQAKPSPPPEQHNPIDSAQADNEDFADYDAPSDTTSVTIPATHQADEEMEKASSTGLSLLEKATLATLAIALLGLAVYSYTWLYKKNLTSNDSALSLPVKGDYITISDFSTYWSDGAGKSTEILPVANITLDQEANSTGALRVYFRNTKNLIMGDPITLPISNGKFIDTRSHNITMKDDGYTVEVISSEGFDQEADFSAYVLDKHMAWSVSVFEADRASASGHEFEKHELININIDAKRK